HERFWAEMTLSPTKYGRSQKWVETYAGYSGESVLLEGLYEDAMKHGRKLDLSFEDEEGWHDLGDLDVYAGNGMLLMWNTRPRCPWQTTAYYTSEERDQTADEFRRIHKNEWITSTAKFVPDAWWEQCREDNQPVWRHSDKITLAADAGVSGDNFALVGTTPRNGRDWVRYVKTWAPPKGGKIDFTGTKAEPGPDREIIRLWLTGQVDEVRYDPYQLHDMATRLANGFVMNGDDPFFPDPAEIRNGRWNGRPVVKVNMVEFSQAGKRAKADKQLYDKIRDQRIAQPGDPVLTQHVQSANQKAEGDKMRIIKRNAKLKVDACVALSMSSYREVDTTPAKRPAMIRG
ncbi:hypothetical protein PZC41_14485, partial [Staphylococcus aureus]|uniref:hypothetical protein n=1 Tax=Staphylococcus aureus TaxID=1280 RepID=UPI0023AFFEF0